MLKKLYLYLLSFLMQINIDKDIGNNTSCKVTLICCGSFFVLFLHCTFDDKVVVKT